MANGNVIEFSLAATDQFSNVFSSFNNALNSTTGKVTAFTAAFVAAGAAAASAITATADAADEMNQLSQQLGTSIDKLSAFTVAAQLNNVEQGSLSSALRVMQREMGKATTETGGAVTAFKLLGVTAQDPIDALKQATAAFSGMKDGAEKTALGIEMFGRQYFALKPLLDAGNQSLQESEQWARDVGIAFDEQAGKAADAFNDSLTMLGQVMEGIRNQAVTPMLPELAAMGDALAHAAAKSAMADVAVQLLRGSLEVIKNVFVAVAQIAFTAGEVIAASFQQVGSLIGGVAAALWEAVQGNFTTAGNIITTMMDDMRSKADSSKESLALLWSEVKTGAADSGTATNDFAAIYVQAMNWSKSSLVALKEEEKARNEADKIAKEEERERLRLAKEAERERTQAAKEAQTQLEASIATQNAYNNSLREFADPMDALLDKQSRLVDLTAQLDAGEDHLRVTRDGLAIATQKAAIEVATLNANNERLTATGADFWTAYAAKMEEARVTMPSWSVALADNMKRATETAIQGLGNSIADFLVNGGSLRQAMEDLGKRIIQQILSDLIADTIRRTLLGAPSAGLAQAEAANAAMLAAAPAIGAAIGNAAAASMAGAAPVTGALPAAGAGGAGLGGGVAAGAAAVGGWAAIRGAQEVDEATGSSAGSALLALTDPGGLLTTIGGASLVKDAGSSIAKVFGWAKGGVFDNGIVTEPTMFSAGGTMNVMGEAGPEAVMPLDRAADGSLGVRMIGGGGGGNITVNATIHIMENATSIDQFASMDKSTLRDKLGRPIIDALNGMFESGFTPEFAK